MKDLITRLSKLDAPDREVDAEIMSLFYMRGKRHIGAYMENDQGLDEPVESDVWIDPNTDRWVSTSAHYFTASVDATIALAERVLPGWKWRVGRTEVFPNGWAYVHKYDPSNCDRIDEAACADGKAANPAIALLIALLRAKEASNAE